MMSSNAMPGWAGRESAEEPEPALSLRAKQQSCDAHVRKSAGAYDVAARRVPATRRLA